MTIHGKPVRGDRQVPLSPINEGRFGRMFRRLSPAPIYTQDQLSHLAEQMHELTPVPAGGWNSAPEPQGGDNIAIPAAYTYLGQFIDHDITFDPNSSLEQLNDPDALHNFRSPRYDLDSVYGSGPSDEPFQYVLGADPAQLLVEPNVNGEVDLPRTSQGVAIIGDPRNDENTIVSQLQLVFLRFHNKIAAEVSADTSVPPEQKFSEAQRRVRWTYQQVVVHDYLLRILGPAMHSSLVQFDPVQQMLDFDLKFYRAKTNAYMPIEFSAAAFRFGHSQVRGIYDLNGAVVGRPVFLPGVVGPLDDLRGVRPIPSGWTVDWAHFIDLPGANPQPSRLIDTHIVQGLFALPGRPLSLPLANLLRGQSMQLPSGQDVARHLKCPTILTAAEMGADVLDPTPLWFYILKEAELLSGGVHLGPVGGTIVGEVLLGMICLDKTSWVNVDPLWTPTIPVTGSVVTLADVIAYATT